MPWEVSEQMSEETIMGDVMATTAGSTPDLRTVRSANGMVLAYRELGAGPPVLLLHGWPTSS